MLNDHMTRSGDLLFRWRSYLPLIFLPGIVWAASHGEPVETALGEPLGDALEILALLVVLAGLAVRVLTVGVVPAGTSGRNVAGQVAEALNTSGAYSLCRNPLYLGNCLIYLGAALFTQDLWLTVLMALALALYYERIISAEEAFLTERFGDAYRDWARRTPAFFPRLTGWRAPDMRFSLATVIRREQSTWFGALLVVAAIALGQDMADPSETAMDTGWLWALGAGAVLYAMAYAMKRMGRLHVEGR